MENSDDAERMRILAELSADRHLAHEVLFSHRHQNATPAFHNDIIDDFYSSEPRVLELLFRGSAKSTRAEECACLLALFGEVHNLVVVGDSFARACDRLRAIKHELETNEFLIWLFGAQDTGTWQEAKLVLPNGVCIQAVGQGQALRGIKHLSWRPDYWIIDDLEDEESVATEEARSKLMKWFLGALVPASDVNFRIRMLATPLDPQSLAARFAESEHWFPRIIPIMHFDAETGEATATWAERYDLEWIEAKRAEMASLGKASLFEHEYMVRAVADEDRVFRQEQFKHPAVARQRHHAVFAMYDPARSVGPRSATTGKVVWSWENEKLIIWESGGHLWLPDQIVADIFDTAERYQPVEIGVEEDGLNEFVMQPINQEMARRRVLLPVEAKRAPKGKLDFIRQLQPFFKAGQVELANGEHKDLVAQLLAFPTGRIDVPNALAYALLRGGQPKYRLPARCIEARRAGRPHQPRFLAAHSDGRTVYVALVEVPGRGPIHVLQDYLEDGSPLDVVPQMLRGLALRSEGDVPAVMPREHFSQYDAIGLRAALRRLSVSTMQGGELVAGEGALRAMLEADDKILISPDALWALRAFLGGAVLEAPRRSRMAERYRLVVAALESFAARLPSGRKLHESRAWRTTEDGRGYLSTLEK